MWSLENVKADLDIFLGPKMTPYTRMSKIKFSTETTKETFAFSKILQWERQISTSWCNWGISWLLQQKIFVERKTCDQRWYPQCPKTWMNNSNWLTKQLTLWTEQIEKFVWLCCGKNRRTKKLRRSSPVICKENGSPEV